MDDSAKKTADLLCTVDSTLDTAVACKWTEPSLGRLESRRGGGYSHTLPVRVCAAQRGRDFEAPDLERGIHFRGVF